jgi:hypothetical protein
VVRHIFQACPVWIYTQSNITSILYEYYKERDLRSSFLKVPNCSMDLVL